MTEEKKAMVSRRFKNVANSATFKNIVKINSLDKKKVLDIGCSWGEFLVHFGPGSLGVTIADEEVAWGRENNLNIINSDIEKENNEISENTFEVIFANNIFEHLESPHNFLLNIKKYLSPGSMLILGVPCMPRVLSLAKMKKFRGSLGSAHINFFNWFTLAKTVERAGWEITSERGFRFANVALDRLLRPIYPHLYVIAKVDENFNYPGKRQNEINWKQKLANGKN